MSAQTEVMHRDAPLPAYRVAVEVRLRDVRHVDDVDDELAEFDHNFSVSDQGWTVAHVTVPALSHVEAQRLAAAVVVAALDAEPLRTWLH